MAVIARKPICTYTAIFQGGEIISEVGRNESRKKEYKNIPNILHHHRHHAVENDNYLSHANLPRKRGEASKTSHATNQTIQALH